MAYYLQIKNNSIIITEVLIFQFVYVSKYYFALAQPALEPTHSPF
jgi:hypothetical protein